MAAASNNLASIHAHNGDHAKAIEMFSRSRKLYEELGNKGGTAKAELNIGNIYQLQKDPEKALDHFQRSLIMFKEVGDVRSIALCYLNIGSLYLDKGDNRSAIMWHTLALDLQDSIGDRSGALFSLCDLGHSYQDLGEYTKALDHYERSLRISEELGEKRGSSIAMVGMGDVLLALGRPKEAVRSVQKALDNALAAGALLETKSAYDVLYRSHKALGESDKALHFHELLVQATDSLASEENQREVLRQEYLYTYEKQAIVDSLANDAEKQRMQLENEASVAKEKNRRNVLLFSGIGLLGLAGGLYTRLRHTRKSRAAIQKEKDISEGLLLNILPAEVAEELKRKGYADAQHFDKATILFTDFKGFTQASEKLTPQELVAELNVCFEGFDHIITGHGIEKIKTIGDAYMCAGGLPDPTSSSPKAVVYAALEMQAFMKTRKAERDALGKPAFEMRVGIHTGPVVAGIVGVKKFQYDIWGDTVNTASRMESSGEVGKVNISGDTYHLVVQETDLMFTPRGKIQAKGKRDLEMFFVEWRS